jgi:hypothetical protein
MPPTYAIANHLYLRILGLCAMTAFAAMYAQAPGLVGSTGLTPIAATMRDLAAARGGADWWFAPTVFWWSTDDAFVQGVFAAGVLAGALLLLGVAPRFAAVVGYVVAISVRATEPAGFRWFNWPYDSLLAESLFVGIWLAPWCWWSSPRRPTPPAPWARWLLLWLLFRLILGTGVTKLGIGGAWFDGTAVQQFVLTQPFPTALAPLLHDGPRWLLLASCVYTMAYEVLAPWFFWWRGRPARIAGLLGIVLMVGIHAIGSFRGFNWLTIGMLLLLFDDAWWQRTSKLLRARVVVAPRAPASRLARVGAAGVLGLVAAASFEPLALQAGARHDTLPLATLRETLRPFRLAEGYWVFCLVPPLRTALVIQGSDDGTQWHDYQPHGLPARIDQRPARVAPGNDHLGFLMWLSGFGGPETAVAWQPALLDALLRGEDDVQALFAHDPFPARPPQHVRAARFLYTFAPAAERDRGVFWQRQLVDVHATRRR